MLRFCVRFVLALFALHTLSASDTEINLLLFDKIDPAYMHGKVTGVRRWLMSDTAREQFIQRHHEYISPWRQSASMHLELPRL